MPKPGPRQLLIRLRAAALNHRDLFIRRHQYPAISFGRAILCDGCGIVVAMGPSVSRAGLGLHSTVVLTPMRGWVSDPAGPEDARNFGVTGASRLHDLGTAQDYIVVDEDELELAPSHLSPVETAALPCVGLTGWRALVTKALCGRPGCNILVTGIGGGVALQVLQFAVAFGCNAYVTSSDEAKIEKARQLGAKGGVLYKEQSWDRQLLDMLPDNRQFLDAIIDGAGGDIVSKAARLLKPGGVIVQYGMTVSPKMDWLMQAVLCNIELKGTTMGSRQEFREMMAFVKEKKIRPVISRTVRGLEDIDAIESLFSDMESGRQFGKLVIEMDAESSSRL